MLYYFIINILIHIYHIICATYCYKCFACSDSLNPLNSLWRRDCITILEMRNLASVFSFPRRRLWNDDYLTNDLSRKCSQEKPVGNGRCSLGQVKKPSKMQFLAKHGLIPKGALEYKVSLIFCPQANELNFHLAAPVSHWLTIPQPAISVQAHPALYP